MCGRHSFWKAPITALRRFGAVTHSHVHYFPFSWTLSFLLMFLMFRLLLLAFNYHLRMVLSVNFNFSPSFTSTENQCYATYSFNEPTSTINHYLLFLTLITIHIFSHYYINYSIFSKRIFLNIILQWQHIWKFSSTKISLRIFLNLSFIFYLVSPFVLNTSIFKIADFIFLVYTWKKFLQWYGLQ